MGKPESCIRRRFSNVHAETCDTTNEPAQENISIAKIKGSKVCKTQGLTGRSLYPYPGGGLRGVVVVGPGSRPLGGLGPAHNL